MIEQNSIHQFQAIRYPVIRQAGDTLVEVLISLAIISTVLGGAFVLTRNSRLGVRNAQEHTIAIKMLENQLEQMRSNAANGGAIFTIGGPFCMFNQAPVLLSTGNCRVDETNTPVPATTQPNYSISINDCNTAGCPDFTAGSHLYTATIKWAEIHGGTAQETMAYRLYQ